MKTDTEIQGKLVSGLREIEIKNVNEFTERHSKQDKIADLESS